MATRTAEQYLKLIFTLSQRETMSLTQLARMLGVSSASVTGMIKRLKAQGLLLHQSYGGVELTSRGNDIAVRLLRRHRIAESYLYAKLQYPLYLLHDEADALEHHMSDYLEEKMNEALDGPSFDPHGHAIPDTNGKLPEFHGIPLSEAAAGSVGSIVSVPDNDALFLRHLVDIGCLPGREVEVLGRDTETAALRMRINGDIQAISEGHAQEILFLETGVTQSNCFEEFLSSIKTTVK
jgi:DtxR family Mn-dependent transcriptional regulator